MARASTESPVFHERRAGPLRAAMDNTVRAWDGVETGRLFGCPAYLVDGSPFAVVSDGGVALAGLSADDRDRLRTRWSALTVEWPVSDGGGDTRVRTDGGRRDAWPLVPIGGNDLVSLRRFVRLSYDGVRGG